MKFSFATGYLAVLTNLLLGLWFAGADPMYKDQRELCELTVAASPELAAKLAIPTKIEVNEQYFAVKLWLETQYKDLLKPGKPLLSIVIPAYKEALRLPNSIQKLKEFLDEYDLPVEVLVVIEKSPDNTLEVATAAANGDPRIQVIDNQIQRGKGYAVRSGMLRAQGEFIFFMDADLSTPLFEVIRFLDWFRNFPDVAVLIGDRTRSIKADDHSRKLIRRVLSEGFHEVVRRLSPLDFPDTQAGFKAFRRSALEPIFTRQIQDRFAFDVEILSLAKLLNISVEALDIVWVDDRRSVVRPFVDPIKMLVDVIKIHNDVKRRVENGNEN